MNTLIGRSLVAVAVLSAALASGAAWADGRRAQVGVQVAGPGVAVEYRSAPRVRHAPPHYRPAPMYRPPPYTRHYSTRVWVTPVPVMPYWGPGFQYGPSWSGGYYYYYGPGYPELDPRPAGPQVWIERAPDGAGAADGGAPAPQGWWYWCNDPEGYYPSVRECPGGWQPVAPQAPSGR